MQLLTFCWNKKNIKVKEKINLNLNTISGPPQSFIMGKYLDSTGLRHQSQIILTKMEKCSHDDVSSMD